MNNKAKTIFDENEMIELCRDLGIEIVKSETGKPQLNEKDLEIEDIIQIIDTRRKYDNSRT